MDKLIYKWTNFIYSYNSVRQKTPMDKLFMKNMSNIYLNNGKTYGITTNLPDRLHELVLTRMKQPSDAQLTKLRNRPSGDVLNITDKLINVETNTTTHAISLLWLKRELDEFITFKAEGNNGIYVFEIKSNGIAFEVVSRQFKPIGAFKTPFDDFIDVGYPYEVTKPKLYEAYCKYCMVNEIPAMTKIAFGKALKVYFPQLKHGRHSDSNRTHYVSGIRVKEGIYSCS